MLDRQSIHPVCVCERCGGEIYPDEERYIWEETCVCVDCFQGAVTAWVKEAAEEVALALGVERRSVRGRW